MLALLTILVIGLAGCAGAGSKISPEQTTAQFGPLPENWQNLVATCISESLIDPMSGMYKWYEPQSKSNGWYGLVMVNAKNRFGGYAGNTLFEWLIVNGKVDTCNQHIMAGFLR
jgi:hypothetical protein